MCITYNPSGNNLTYHLATKNQTKRRFWPSKIVWGLDTGYLKALFLHHIISHLLDFVNSLGNLPVEIEKLRRPSTKSTLDKSSR